MTNHTITLKSNHFATVMVAMNESLNNYSGHLRTAIDEKDEKWTQYWRGQLNELLPAIQALSPGWITKSKRAALAEMGVAV